MVGVVPDMTKSLGQVQQQTYLGSVFLLATEHVVTRPKELGKGD